MVSTNIEEIVGNEFLKNVVSTINEEVGKPGGIIYSDKTNSYFIIWNLTDDCSFMYLDTAGYKQRDVATLSYHYSGSNSYNVDITYTNATKETIRERSHQMVGYNEAIVNGNDLYDISPDN